MITLDFKKEFGEFYFPSSKEVSTVRIPRMNYAMVDGTGYPSTSTGYQEAIEALYGLSYTAKFTLKLARIADYKVGPLESLWSTGTGNGFVVGASPDSWKWTAMIMQPRPVTRTRFHDALTSLREKKQLPAVSKLRFDCLEEGTVAQILHVGPYSEERVTVERIRAFIAERGGKPVGKHHEIYLSDPRRTVPARLKTVLRQPFVR
jgi:hypothetical protein